MLRPKKRFALIKRSLLLEVASHAAMGIAVGLAFALLVAHFVPLGATLINSSPDPAATLRMLVRTCAATFGIGATLTGLAMTLTDGRDATDIE
jgi:hypothetical protein